MDKSNVKVDKIETDTIKARAISFESADGKIITLTFEAVDKLLNKKETK